MPEEQRKGTPGPRQRKCRWRMTAGMHVRPAAALVRTWCSRPRKIWNQPEGHLVIALRFTCGWTDSPGSHRHHSPAVMCATSPNLTKCAAMVGRFGLLSLSLHRPRRAQLPSLELTLHDRACGGGPPDRTLPNRCSAKHQRLANDFHQPRRQSKMASVGEVSVIFLVVFVSLARHVARRKASGEHAHGRPTEPRTKCKSGCGGGRTIIGSSGPATRLWYPCF